MSVLPLEFANDGFRPLSRYNENQQRFDTIVIGSGMGGMSCASALSQHGQRVLVLEQHSVPGGFTHRFRRRQFCWDVGVHAIGEMDSEASPRRILDWLTGGRVEMRSLGDTPDHFRFPDGLRFEITANRETFVRSLINRFSSQEKRLLQYFAEVDQAVAATRSYFVWKNMSSRSGANGNDLHPLERGWTRTTEQVLDLCGIQGILRRILTAHWGYYGSVPRDSSFNMHALTHAHFRKGAYYPVGGSTRIASAMLAVIRAAGGQVLTRARVAGLIRDGRQVTGVRLRDGKEFQADRIVSGIGAKNTVTHLIPCDWRRDEWAQSIQSLPGSPPYLCLNLGFCGDIAAAGASSENQWVFTSHDEDQTFWNCDDPEELPHILFCSFPSLKDPQYDPGPEQFHTGECITFVPSTIFQKWRSTLTGERPKDYQDLKRRLEQRLMNSLRKAFPEVMEHLVYSELSTPLTAEHFTRAENGAMYGLAAIPERFLSQSLRAQTPYPGLFLTGSDITTTGIVGAMSAGVLTAVTIDRRIRRSLV